MGGAIGGALRFLRWAFFCLCFLVFPLLVKFRHGAPQPDDMTVILLTRSTGPVTTPEGPP